MGRDATFGNPQSENAQRRNDGPRMSAKSREMKLFLFSAFSRFLAGQLDVSL
jgi:hypothetical protein